MKARVAVVTGGTYGIGRGVARVLAQCGAEVFATGRSANDAERNVETVRSIRCDHRQDAEVRAAFECVVREAGNIDILVYNVWGGYEGMMEDGKFTWTRPF